LPGHPDLNYKQIPATRALKAIYNGNYITSDRAWYTLLDYAEKMKEEVTPLPLEVFHNNPNMGGNELQWKAEIYMPLKEKSDE
jgi:effector-binding domain-containing protein